MVLETKLYVTFQRRFLAFWNPIDPYNWNPFGLINFSDFLEFVDTLPFMLVSVKCQRDKFVDGVMIIMN